MIGKSLVLMLLIAFGGEQVYAWEARSPNFYKQCMAKRTPVNHLIPLEFLPNFAHIPEFFLAKFAVEPSFSNKLEWLLQRNKNKYKLVSREYLADHAADSPIIKNKQISTATADLILDIWINELREVRYPVCSTLGLDGATYTFEVNTPGIGLSGTTWSPHEDLPPKWMVDAGDAVLDFVNSEKSERELQKELVEIRNRLFTYLTEHGRAL